MAGGSSSGSGPPPPRGSRPCRSAPTPTARSGCRPRSAASSASSRPMAGSAAAEPSPSATASTTSGPGALGRRPGARLRRDAGAGPRRPCLRRRPPAPVTPQLAARRRDGLRVGIAGGWFDATPRRGPRRRRTAWPRRSGATPVDRARRGRGRPGGGLPHHQCRERRLPSDRACGRRAADFDPDTRDRFLAGAMLPAAWVVRAQRVRHWWLGRALAAFRDIDLLVAPATPSPAPAAGEKTVVLAGRSLPLRRTSGCFAALLLHRAAGRHRAGLRPRRVAARRPARGAPLERDPLPPGRPPPRAGGRRDGAAARADPRDPETGARLNTGSGRSARERRHRSPGPSGTHGGAVQERERIAPAPA